jgi:hypothetical protein
MGGKRQIAGFISDWLVIYIPQHTISMTSIYMHWLCDPEGTLEARLMNEAKLPPASQAYLPSTIPFC